MTGAFGVSGGIAAVNRNNINALVESAHSANWSLNVLALHESEPPNELADSVNQYQVCRGSQIRFSLNLLKLLASSRVVIVDHVGLAAPMMLVPKSMARRVLVWAHGSESWKRMKHRSMVVFRRVGAVLANSHFTAARVGERVPCAKVEVCQLGIPPERQLALSPKPTDDQAELRLRTVDGKYRSLGSQVLLQVGRQHALEGEKGQLEVMRSVANLASEYPDLQLVIAGGGGYIDALKEFANRLKISGRCFLPGEVSNQQLEALYRCCTVYAMPSKQEGFGIVFVEAMLAAKPCIGFSPGGADDIIVPQKTGLLVSGERVAEATEQAIRQLLENPEVAARYGQAGRRHALEKFSSAAAQKRFLSALAQFGFPAGAPC